MDSEASKIKRTTSSSTMEKGVKWSPNLVEFSDGSKSQAGGSELPERLRGGVREEREGEGEGEEVGRGETQDQRNQPNLLWYEANAY